MNLKTKNKKSFCYQKLLLQKKKNLPLENLINEIMISIEEIGFDNTANIYSIAESAKLGGKLGWINESSLSKKILENLNSVNEKNQTEIIKFGKIFLYLKLKI